MNHYQPIVSLQTGRVLGVEAFGRLVDGADIIMPGVFLPDLGVAELTELLFVSLTQGAAALAECTAAHPELFISFNVSSTVMLERGFLDRLMGSVALTGLSPSRIVLEILETDEFLNLDAAQALFDTVHGAGIGIAIDDLGSGYSSLNRLRQLPVDKIKLDQGFVRGLQHNPESLPFVVAMLSLARGLRKDIIIEGVETPEIMDALGVLGVDAAQGYAIARPMPAPALIEWLAGHEPRPVDREPKSLLGAYAAHLSIVEACRALLSQPLPVQWSNTVRDPHSCSIGRYFDRNGLHDTAFGRAHKRFHAVIDRYDDDPVAWEAAGSDLWLSLQQAIRMEAERPAGRPPIMLPAEPVATAGQDPGHSTGLVSSAP